MFTGTERKYKARRNPHYTLRWLRFQKKTTHLLESINVSSDSHHLSEAKNCLLGRSIIATNSALMDLLFTRQVRGVSHYPTNSHRRLIINWLPRGTGCSSPWPKLPAEKRPSRNCDNPQQRRCVGLSSGKAQQRSRRQHKRLVSHAEMRLCLRSVLNWSSEKSRSHKYHSRTKSID